jgi:L-ribulose-5-phosphate 4-epimerase
MLDELKAHVCWANRQLPAKGLVSWTSGNVAARDPESGLVVVKPSGVLFDEMTPEMMLLVELGGRVVEGDLKPSVDAATALYILREMPDLHAVVHTHSGYASSFAVLGRDIPVYLTEHGDAFGIPIPCAGYAKIGGTEIGEEVVRVLRETGHQCPAVLMQNHGVFTVGTNVRGALKAAVVVEDIARTVHLAMTKGEPIPIPPEESQRLYDVYHTRYGQKPGGGFE